MFSIATKIMANTIQKPMCAMCAPKETFAITSCKGCFKDFCRKHFNDHRDILSKSLHHVIDLHDTLLQELQFKIDNETKEPVDSNACTILKQIDDWEKTTLECISKAANKVRVEVKRSCTRKMEFDQFNQKISDLTKELKEQQESESFIETDINQWINKLEQIKIDLNRPLKFHMNETDLQIKNIDWNDVIKISSGAETPDVESLWVEKWLAMTEMLLKMEKEEKKELVELAKEKEQLLKQKQKELEQKEMAFAELKKKLPWWKK